MIPVPKIVQVSRLRRDTVQVLRLVQQSDRPFMITESDEVAAVLVGVEAYFRSAKEVDEAMGTCGGSAAQDKQSVGEYIQRLLPNGKHFTMDEVERVVILDRLQRLGGNRTRAAESLGMGLRTVQRKLKEYGQTP